MRDAGLVLAAYVVWLVVENLAVGIAYRGEFAGAWEMAIARTYLSPLALVLLVPFAFALVLLARLASRSDGKVVAAIAGGCGAVLAVGVSSGRLVSSLAIRAPLVVVVAGAAAFVGLTLARRLPHIAPQRLAALGAVVAALAWLADAFVLPRLYPAFHLALLGIALVAWGALALVARGTRSAAPLAGVAIAVAAFSAAWAPHAAAKARTADNLRRVLLEHAPLLGRAVVVAARIAPPPPLEDDEGSATTTLTSLHAQGARSVDWTGRDLVVVTIDALRADHVSAYGYARRTTPNIDALAARGVRFDHAYCPTPHTSYSVASMMTGKYMRPLLALGAGDDGETWPVQLRRYGYRTAAFYPPAVFFIDEHRFRHMRDTHLGFEYAKEEFARPELRREQLAAYLATAPRDKPLFLWIHLFDPHEPYEMHPEHPFSGDPRIDAYDSEIASADAFVGDVVTLVGERRPQGAVFVVSADHGEEHGDHGGRYHGTTVYEEQVRVPLVVAAPGLAPRVVETPVQTIDLLPTSLAALDVPIPPRLRGRDLGPLLVGTAPTKDEGLAFAETDDYTLVARASDRLVCARKIASCTLFDVAKDAAEKNPVSDRPARVDELRRLGAAIERETGKVEVQGLPEALRRGLQGDLDAAEDVAPLLDDARVEIRRAAARCGFRLKAASLVPQLRRALSRDDDAEVRRWSAIALVRIGETTGVPDPDALLKASPPGEERAAAALALAEHGDGRGEADLVHRWTTAFGAHGDAGELDEARALLAAFSKLRARSAVPALVRSAEDVRLRAYVVEALGEIGDTRAREPLLRLFEAERYLNVRPTEASALFALGARDELYPPLLRFAGTPEPMVEAIGIAAAAKLLVPQRGGAAWGTKEQATVKLSTAGPARLLVSGEGGGLLHGSIGRMSFLDTAPFAGKVWVVEAGEIDAGDVPVTLTVGQGKIDVIWLVPRSEEIPPPPPRAWLDGGVE